MNILKKNGYDSYRKRMVEKMETLQKICLVLTIVGALNWGLIGILDFNLVSTIFGSGTMLEKLIYILVGLAGIINIGILFNHIENA